MSNKKDLFFSTDNFNMLYEMLSLDIKKKFNSDIENNNVCRQILFSNMDSTFSKSRNKNLKELNIITIQHTGPLLYQKIHEGLLNTPGELQARADRGRCLTAILWTLCINYLFTMIYVI